MHEFSRRHWLVASALLVTAIAANEASAFPVVTSYGTAAPPGQSVNAGAVRLRNFGNRTNEGDLYLGVDGLATGANRVQAPTGAITWTSPSSVAFSFAYDTALDQLVATVGSTTLTYTSFLNQVSTLVPSVASLDWGALQISVTMRSASGTTPTLVSLSDVELNGTSLSPDTFSGVLTQTNNWLVTGYDFGTSFTLTGNINLAGTFVTASSTELNAINIGFGNNPNFPVPAVPEPASLAIVALAGLGFAGYGLRRRKQV